MGEIYDSKLYSFMHTKTAFLVHNTKTSTKSSKTCAREGRMFKNLPAGGQTTAHGVRMLRQVFKIGFSISMAFGLLYFGWFLYQQPQENYKAFYYLAKSKITFEETVLIRAESWKEINRTPKKKHSKKLLLKKSLITVLSQKIL